MAVDPDWWNSSYLYRRNLEIVRNLQDQANSEIGDIVDFVIPYADFLDGQKIKADGSDIGVILCSFADGATPVFNQEPIPRIITIIEKFQLVQIQFILPQIVEDDNYSYWLYYGNPSEDVSLVDIEPTLTLLPSLNLLPSEALIISPEFDDYWPKVKTPKDDMIAYTRPLDYWDISSDIAISKDNQAQLFFQVFSSSFRIIGKTGPTYGIAEVQIDDDLWSPIDQFSLTETIKVLCEYRFPPEDISHRARIRATGRKNPSSRGTNINISRIDLINQYNVLVSQEAINPNINWSASSGGSS